jgi:putative transcriptional regulator
MRAGTVARMHAWQCRVMGLVVAAVAAGVVPVANPVAVPPAAAAEGLGVTGRLLVAAPDMADPRFDEAVIYIVSHDGDGAFGIVVNRPLGVGVPHRGGVAPDGRDAGKSLTVNYGGPVDSGTGYVLHTSDYAGPHTLNGGGKGALGATSDSDRALFEAILAGRGPRRHLVVLGYAGWGPGQLDREIEASAWVTADADETFVFDTPAVDMWRLAYARRGYAL